MKVMLPAKEHRRLVVVCAVVAALVAAALAGSLLLGSSSDGASGENTATTSSGDPGEVTEQSAVPPSSAGTRRKPSARLDRASAIREAGVALKTFLALSDKALQSLEDELGPVAAVAQDTALSELENTVAEYRTTRIRQAGSVRIAGEHAVEVELDDAPYRVTLEVCIDATDVMVTDNRGEPVSARPANEVRRTPHLYTIELAGKAWKVAEHRFPTESTC